jgi:hypothetical protein
MGESRSAKKGDKYICNLWRIPQWVMGKVEKKSFFN